MDLKRKRHAENCNSSTDKQAYKKSEVQENYILPKTDKKKKGRSPTSDNLSVKNHEIDTDKEVSPNEKKPKFVSLYSQEGQEKDVILLKGRHLCECQASKHKLINNCLKCGRIVCKQEGSGACLFCGNLVCTQQEQSLLNSGSVESEELYEKLMDKERINKSFTGWQAAMAQRNRLLEYDRTSESRTRVIDDESDYFLSNSVWLSKSEREKLKQREEELHAKRHASRLEKKFTLDFAGRQVLEEDEEEGLYSADDSVLQSISKSVSSKSSGDFVDDCNVDPVFVYSQPIFQNVGSVTGPSTHKDNSIRRGSASFAYRVQDREFLEMSDEGSCLSLHQPWASLLVSGIKRHEGRTWYTAHRGRLWLAAASKVPTPQEIEEAEQSYRILIGDENLKFPSQYPASCLLGCVDLVACLQQEEYLEKFPDGESNSPFVFICENPQELPIKFPLQGKHKIYKLDPKIHQAAKKSLQRAAKLKAASTF